MSDNNLYRKTPLMGWASWNAFRTNISEAVMKEQADALISTGLCEYGYTYLNMDDGFFGGRDKNGVLQFHKTRFPNGIKVIADYAHSLGLKAGIYSDAGDKTCGFYYDNEGENGFDVGLYNHEEQDLKMYLEDFGFDFIKVDWCGGLRLGLDEEEQYTKIGNIIDTIRHRTKRSIVYNICRWQFPGVWATKVADSWRTGADIAPDFDSVLHQLDVIKPLVRYTSPSHVNDLDMMQIGNGMSIEDEKTHFAMWCMMSTPLMIGCDLTKIKPDTLQILKNKELIDINQDSACIQAFVIKEIRDDDDNLLGEVWVKDLGKKNSCQKALAFLNRSNSPLKINFDFKDAGLVKNIKSIRNLSNHTNEDIKDSVSLDLKAHETVVLRVLSDSSTEIKNPYDIGFISTPINKITLESAKELVLNGATLVDVRSSEEYNEKHLDNAINIYYGDIHAIAGNFLKDKSKPIILYCSTGKRSMQAIGSLDYLGYKNLYNLCGIEL